MGGGNRRGQTTQSIVRQPLIQPDRVFLKLKSFVYGAFQSATAGAFSANTLRLNDCSDPLGSLGSSTPVGFSDWCSASSSSYRFYRVHAFSALIEAVPEGQNGSYPVITMGLRNGSTAAPTTIVQASGQSRCVSRLSPTTMTAYSPMRLRLYGKTSEVYGVSPQTVAAADAFAAQYNASPSNVIIADVCVQDALSTTQFTFVLKIEITQWVEIYGRNTAS